MKTQLSQQLAKSHHIVHWSSALTGSQTCHLGLASPKPYLLVTTLSPQFWPYWVCWDLYRDCMQISQCSRLSVWYFSDTLAWKWRPVISVFGIITVVEISLVETDIVTVQISQCSRLSVWYFSDILAWKWRPVISVFGIITVVEISLVETDIVTVQISQCSRLSVLSLRNNNLSSLPPEIGKMRRLRVLDVIGNK